VDERLNKNRYPMHSVLREIQELIAGDLADLVTSLTPHLSAIVACFDFWREICHPAFSDFCNTICHKRP
jgi:hypothetical protein